MSANVNKLTTKVEALEAEPGKKWRDAVKTVISCVVTAVVVYILAKVGL